MVFTEVFYQKHVFKISAPFLQNISVRLFSKLEGIKSKDFYNTFPEILIS